MPSYWLMKSEPATCSISDVAEAPGHKVPWIGVRNYQARNFMRDEMRVGDLVLFYHSLGTPESPSGVYASEEVQRKPPPDETQFDKKDMHYDPKAKPELPIWACVDVAFVRKFKSPVT